MLVSSISTFMLLIASALKVQARYLEPALYRRDLPECHNIHSNFKESIGDWTLERGSSAENYEITPEGLKMKILPPSEYIPLEEEVTLDNGEKQKLRYNKIEGAGFTFNASTYMQYGKFSSTVKSARVPGAVTAIILIADNGDEIDFEFLAGPKDQVTTNFFYGPHIVYGANGDVTDTPGKDTYDVFHKYTIEWSPQEITWSIDGKLVRTVKKEKTKNKDGVYEYPTHAARVQIGLWDGSGASGTAQWARGPIIWKDHNEPITAYIKDVEITCDPKHNNVVNY